MAKQKEQPGLPIPDPDETPQDRNGRLWLEALSHDLNTGQRRHINEGIDDALVLLALVSFHISYVELQSNCVEYDLTQERLEMAEERWGWIQRNAEIAIQAAIDLNRLMYQTEEKGGVAGKAMYPEIHMAVRMQLAITDTAAARIGNPSTSAGCSCSINGSCPEPGH